VLLYSKSDPGAKSTGLAKARSCNSSGFHTPLPVGVDSLQEARILGIDVQAACASRAAGRS
jgi:hypothetical protein